MNLGHGDSNLLQKGNTFFVVDESISSALCSFQRTTVSLHGLSGFVIPDHGETYKTHTVIRLLCTGICLKQLLAYAFSPRKLSFRHRHLITDYNSCMVHIPARSVSGG